MANDRQKITQVYRGQARDIEQWRASQTAEVEAEAEEAKAKARKQASATEAEVQAVSGELRTAQRKETRKKSLPYTKPNRLLDTKARLKAIEAVGVESAAATQRYYGQVEAEKSKILTDINHEADLALAEVEDAKRESLAAYDKAVAEFDAKYVKVARNDYIERSVFDSLDTEAQTTLKRYGIAYYNSHAKLAQARVKASTVQLNTGEYVSKADYNALSMSDKLLLNRVGIDKFNDELARRTALPITITAEGVVTEGNVPVPESFAEWAKSKGYMTVEVEPTYQYATPLAVPVTGADKAANVFKTINNLYKPTDRQRADLAADRRFNWLPAPARDALISINNVVELVTPKVDVDIRQDPAGFAKETAKQVAIYTVPFVWTVDWNKLTPTQRIINTAIDVAIIVSLGVGEGLGRFKARPLVNAAKESGAASNVLDDALKTLARTPVDHPNYAQVASNAQKAINASRAADTKFIDKLLAADKVTPGLLTTLERKSGITGLKQAVMDVSKAQSELRSAWSALDKYGFGSKNYVKGINKVQAIQNKLNVALETFNNKIEPRYKLSPAPPEFQGYAVQYKMELLPTIDEGMPTVEPLPNKSGGVQLAVLDKTAPKVSFAEVYKVKTKPVYTEAPKVTPKVTKVPKVTPSSTSVVSVGLGKRTPKPSEVAEYEPSYRESVYERADVTLEPDYVEAIGTPISGTMLAVSQGTAIEIGASARDMTDANIKIADITKALIKDANRLANQGKTADQIKNSIDARIEPMVRAITEPKIRTMVETRVGTIVDVVTRLSLKRGLKRVPPIYVPTKEGKRKLTPKEVEGMVAWKQGFIYKLVYPPYGQHNIVNTKTPIKGVQYHEGARSAYNSIVRLNGQLPKHILRDMGIMDVTITTDNNKPRLSFRPDVKQRTRHRGVIRRSKPTNTQIVISRLIG